MSGSDDDDKQAAPIPSRQQAASKSSGDSVSQSAPPSEGVIDLARRFLQDETVEHASREKKVEFLKSKGLEEGDINRILEQISHASRDVPTPTQQSRITPSPETIPDRSPIITYPEFLTKPTKPPPLITASGLLNSLGLVAGFSTLVYGATKHLVNPMVDTLTEARVDFHHTANNNLLRLVERLEHTVSKVPASCLRSGIRMSAVEERETRDDDSTYDDPTELFHRDVGVQTSPLVPSTPPSPFSGPLPSISTPSEQTQLHADRLNRLSMAVRGLATDVIHHAEDLAETKNVLDKFASDLYTLTYPPESFGMGSSYLYGSQRSEPDDEIKRVKMSIRNVKGVLLGTRSFPSTSR